MTTDHKPNWCVEISTLVPDQDRHLGQLNYGSYDVYTETPIEALAFALAKHYANFGYQRIYSIEMENLDA